MLDVEDQVREMLRRRAADVPPRVHPPRGMLRRAWRRILVAFTGGVVVVALLAAGAAAGVRLLKQPSGVGSQVAAPACQAAELRGVVRLQGNQGHVVGSLEVVNAGSRTCSLQGQPSLRIQDRKGTWLGVDEGSTGPWWTVQSRPEPKGWPIVTLQPGGSARLHVVWNSWCGFAQPLVWRIWLREAGTLDLPDPKSQQPHCEGISSKVQVGPFEPVT
ncbi:MAG TPA: DUF4232 domain-containing protein [Actinomycetota bacterium]